MEGVFKRDKQVADVKLMLLTFWYVTLLKFSKEDLEFKQEVEGFLDANYPLDIKEKQDRRYPLDKSDVIKWQKILSKRGWFAITWPKEYGGSDLSPTKKYILQNELAASNTKTNAEAWINSVKTPPTPAETDKALPW